MDEIARTLLDGAPAFRKRKGRPLVTLSYAQSLDGSIALRAGQATAISGPQSLKMTHQLRTANDAILVGIGTVLADDPQLTVREVEGDDPQPVVLDSRLRFPLDARLLQNVTTPWIFCTASAGQDAQKVLEESGARVFRQSGSESEQLDLATVLQQLADLEVDSLMVEGGAGVIASFLKSAFTDQVAITIAPIFIGGLKVLETPLADLQQEGFPRIDHPQITPLGDDVVIWGRMLGVAE